MRKKEILILFGGSGSEHEVSCMSAASVLDHIDREKYNIRTVGITKEGKWIETAAPAEKIKDGTWIRRINNREVYISPDRTFKGMRTLRGREYKLDCVFPVLHGKFGEDGTIQGLLEISGIPYVGCGVLSSACAMDKVVTKALVGNLGIRQAKYCVTDRYTFSSRPAEELSRIERVFRDEYPLFVKPAGEGSSIGITKATTRKELLEGIEKAALADHKILIEEAIAGREMEVAVLGNRSPHASPIGEIFPGEEFYTYDAKYNNPISRTEIVSNLLPTKECEMKDAAIAIYKILGCRGMARVDFFYSEDGEVVFNEINTIPGFTEISMYPMMWEAAGIGYTELIDRLIELAMEEE